MPLNLDLNSALPSSFSGRCPLCDDGEMTVTSRATVEATNSLTFVCSAGCPTVVVHITLAETLMAPQHSRKFAELVSNKYDAASKAIAVAENRVTVERREEALW